MRPVGQCQTSHFHARCIQAGQPVIITGVRSCKLVFRAFALPPTSPSRRCPIGGAPALPSRWPLTKARHRWITRVQAHVQKARCLHDFVPGLSIACEMAVPLKMQGVRNRQCIFTKLSAYFFGSRSVFDKLGWFTAPSIHHLVYKCPICLHWFVCHLQID